jgi:hypothetical protein
MDFESYKEQLIELLKNYKNKIQDSETYIRLKEKYDNLPQNYQYAILSMTVLLLFYFIYSIPASFVSVADEKIGYFEENRQLTRELIRAGRIARTIQLPPPAPSAEALTSQVENILLEERVLPEQKTATTPMPEVASSKIVPKSINQTGLKTALKQITLKQIIKIGESINNINSTKLMNIAILADKKDPHYYNVDYEVAAFSVPLSASPVEEKPQSKFKSKFRRSQKKESNE